MHNFAFGSSESRVPDKLEISVDLSHDRGRFAVTFMSRANGTVSSYRPGRRSANTWSEASSATYSSPDPSHSNAHGPVPPALAADEEIVVSEHVVAEVQSRTSSAYRRTPYSMAVHSNQVVAKRRRITPLGLEDDLARWKPNCVTFADDPYATTPDDTPLELCGGDEEDIEEVGTVRAGLKRKSCGSSRGYVVRKTVTLTLEHRISFCFSWQDQMKKWEEGHAESFLDELFALGVVRPCDTCGTTSGIFVKCTSCEELVECAQCCLKTHSRLPLHVVEV